jgi:cytochrome b561
MEYFRERQPPEVRYLHFTILCLVLSQIIISNFMGFAANNEVSKNIIQYCGTWIHIGTGLFLVPTAFAFICIELKRHGLDYFFPYFYGNYSQLKKDVQQLVRFKLPEPSAYGIAAVVQGLGLGALSLVLLSGFTWFLSWVFMAPWSDSIKSFHQLLTGLIAAYVVGHGGMGLLHIFLQIRNPKKR